jgi:hypothetical protein
MNQIVPHSLWLGHAGDGRDYRRLFDVGIKAVISLAAEERPDQPPRELVYCRFPLLDGTGNDAGLLQLAVSTVAALVCQKVPTLVCCGMGLSRSPAVVAIALARVFRGSPEEWLHKVAEYHTTDVSPSLWAELNALSEVG